jgi:TfoX/Sxy family transcriptional regulator of competence genes
MPAEKGSMHWERSPAELSERFTAVTDRHPDIARRKMFGEIAGFVNGNMVTGLHSGRWFVRLTGDDKAEALALAGAGPFEPMPGRPMGDYIVLPPAVVDDDAALDGWLGRAIAVGQALKPK